MESCGEGKINISSYSFDNIVNLITIYSTVILITVRHIIILRHLSNVASKLLNKSGHHICVHLPDVRKMVTIQYIIVVL